MAEENNGEAPKKKSNGRWFLYSVAIIPIVSILASFLVVRVINPRFAASADGYSVQLALNHWNHHPVERKNNDKKEEFLCDVGTILANPSGTERRRIIKMSIMVDVFSESLIETIEKMKPKLQHQAVMILSSKDLETISSTEGKIELQSELKKAFIDELGLTNDDIRQVYFRDFVIQ